MVGMLKRMRRLQERLFDIRHGPGAAILAPNVYKLHLSFAPKFNKGHLGPRKFWHEMLPRLKYHNPAIPMTVERHPDQEGPATLTVFYADPTAASVTAGPEKPNAPTQSTSGDKIPSDHTPWDRTHVIDVKGRDQSEILAELLRVTEGKEVVPTDEERAKMAELAEQRQKSNYDREEVKKVLLAKRREQEILEQARKSVEAQAG